jgi:hypothetical protein
VKVGDQKQIQQFISVMSAAINAWGAGRKFLLINKTINMRTKMIIKVQPGIKSFFLQAIFFLLNTTNVIAQNSSVIDEGPAVSVTAKVVSINQKSRKVKLKTGDGQWQIFTAGNEVTNLDQIKKGDSVTILYTEGFAYHVRKHGSPTGTAVSDTAVAAGLGAQQAGDVQKQTTTTATITAIDSSVPSVTLKGPYKETQTIKVKHPEHLDGVKVGDVVDISYTDAIAIKVIKSANK